MKDNQLPLSSFFIAFVFVALFIRQCQLESTTDLSRGEFANLKKSMKEQQSIVYNHATRGSYLLDKQNDTIDTILAQIQQLQGVVGELQSKRPWKHVHRRLHLRVYHGNRIPTHQIR